MVRYLGADGGFDLQMRAAAVEQKMKEGSEGLSRVEELVEAVRFPASVYAVLRYLS